MKKILLLLLLLSLCHPAFGAGIAPPQGTNQMVIMAENGFEYAPPTVVYRGNVRVLDPQMELMCEQLTVYFQTNNDRIEMIIAETNVLMVQNETWAAGDRAVYSATNDVVTLSGNVVLDTPQGYLIGSTIIYDRKLNKLFAPGKVIMGSHPGGGLFGTNTFGLNLPGAKAMESVVPEQPQTPPEMPQPLPEKPSPPAKPKYFPPRLRP